MTEFELLELADMQITRIGWASMNMLTLIFGYLTVAYLVGKKFRPVIAMALTVVYSIGLLPPFLVALASISALRTTWDQYALLFPGGAFSPLPWILNLPTVAIAVGPLLLGWLVSVLYMHAYIRGASKTVSD